VPGVVRQGRGAGHMDPLPRARDLDARLVPVQQRGGAERRRDPLCWLFSPSAVIFWQSRRKSARIRTGIDQTASTGARLLADLSVARSADTALRAITVATLPARPTPRVLGVDDWAKRKGQTYGAILVDLERHRVVDLLPDRSAAAFATWLTAHPGAEIVCRDRGGAYAEGARQGAPDTIQVADRWHLLANLGAALERAVVERPALPATAPAPPAPELVAAPVTAHEQARRARYARREARDRKVQRLRTQGLGYRQIAHQLGLHRATVRKYVAAPTCPLPAPRCGRRCGIDPFLPYLRERWAAGEQRVTVLWQGLARFLRAPAIQPMTSVARRCSSAWTALIATSLAVRALASLGMFWMANRNVPNVPSATIS
jgi:hypothetical protein